MNLRIGHSPLCEPVFLYIHTLPALKKSIQCQSNEPIVRTILLYTTACVKLAPKDLRNTIFVFWCTLLEHFRPSMFSQEAGPITECSVYLNYNHVRGLDVLDSQASITKKGRC